MEDPTEIPGSWPQPRHLLLFCVVLPFNKYKYINKLKKRLHPIIPNIWVRGGQSEENKHAFNSVLIVTKEKLGKKKRWQPPKKTKLLVAEKQDEDDNDYRNN